jgi:hypothetical protein
MSETMTATDAEVAAAIFEHMDRRLQYDASREAERVFAVTYGLVYGLNRGLIAGWTQEGREWVAEMVGDLNAGWTSCKGGPNEVTVPPAEPKLPTPA